MDHIYIFNQESSASQYGIGSYIKHLTYCLKDSTYTISVVTLHTKQKELSVKYLSGIRYIKIPKIHVNIVGYEQVYQESVVYMLVPYISKKDKNIFHLNYENNIYLAKKLKEIFGCPILFTVHYTEWSYYFGGNRKKLNDLIARKESNYKLSGEEKDIDETLCRETSLFHNYCDKIIAISRHSFHDLTSIYKVPKEKIVLINNSLKDQYNPIPASQKLRIKKRLCIAPDDIILLFVGRLHTIKGLKLLINAFKIALKQESKLRLFIVGSGTYNEWLSIAKPAWSRISFTGYLTSKELSQLYSIADIGLIPSIHEEFGLVALEMMMHKLPIIVNNTTGLSEIVENEVTGLIAKKASAKNMAAKIIELTQDLSFRKLIADQGRKKYLKKYSSPLYREKMLRLYKSFYCTSNECL